MLVQKGVIVRLNPAGLAYVEDVKSKEISSFTFNKIDSYSGESAEELGLKLGSQVAFSIADGIVRSVQIPQTSVRAKAHGR